jgi:hypothetical protein
MKSHPRINFLPIDRSGTYIFVNTMIMMNVKI